MQLSASILAITKVLLLSKQVTFYSNRLLYFFLNLAQKVDKGKSFFGEAYMQVDDVLFFIVRNVISLIFTIFYSPSPALCSANSLAVEQAFSAL